MQGSPLHDMAVWLISEDPVHARRIDHHLRDAVRDIEVFENWNAALEAAFQANRLASAPPPVCPDLLVGIVLRADPDLHLAFHHLRSQCPAPLILVLPRELGSYLPLYLGSGADDFLLMPYTHELLLARLEIALRQHAPVEPQASALYQDDYLTIDPPWHRLIVNSEEITCTAIEMKLLDALVNNRGRTVSHTSLIEAAWDTEQGASPAQLHRHIWRLRRKVERDPRQPGYVHTIHGVGYRFDPQY